MSTPTRKRDGTAVDQPATGRRDRPGRRRRPGRMRWRLGPQLRAETRKLRTVRAAWAVLGVGAAVELVLRTVSAVIAPADPTPSEVVFALRPSIAFLVVVALLPLLLAVGEWRWRTAVSTYALQPRRHLVLTAKSLVGVGVGVAVAALLTGLSLGVQVVVLLERGLPLPSTDVLLALGLGPVAGGAALGVVGVALGTLVREQVVALAVAAVLLFVLPLPLLLVGPNWYAWTPTAWIDSLAAQRLVVPQLLPPGIAALLLAGCATASLAIAGHVLERRDLL